MLYGFGDIVVGYFCPVFIFATVEDEIDEFILGLYFYATATPLPDGEFSSRVDTMIPCTRRIRREFTSRPTAQEQNYG
jgi:hypothetical protein